MNVVDPISTSPDAITRLQRRAREAASTVATMKPHRYRASMIMWPVGAASDVTATSTQPITQTAAIIWRWPSVRLDFRWLRLVEPAALDLRELVVFPFDALPDDLDAVAVAELAALE
ncbi:MAG: hypothetical protein V9F03_05685 [Microthrixaceae bacterium]